jgi:hypothetical protein
VISAAVVTYGAEVLVRTAGGAAEGTAGQGQRLLARILLCDQAGQVQRAVRELAEAAAVEVRYAEGVLGLALLELLKREPALARELGRLL